MYLKSTRQNTEIMPSDSTDTRPIYIEEEKGHKGSSINEQEGHFCHLSTTNVGARSSAEPEHSTDIMEGVIEILALPHRSKS